MATVKDTQSRRMYSWWWDSHISPKNSKWLQDNLTDMDSKLKAMIKLIEEDADSFARRAEMYYKKRPELMKLVEEFYRAYRALAERYDHATVVIRQAHKTMTEAFPNQVPPLLGEDSPVNPGPEDDPRTPEVSTHTHALLQTDDVQKDALELSSSHLNDAKSYGENTEGSDFVARRKGFKQSHNLSGSGDYHKLADRRVRKGLNFQDMDEKEQSVESREDHGLVHEPEEILVLRKALADVEAEKEAGLTQYQHSLDKLSKLESEIARAQEDSRELSERASVAEAEVQNLKDAITKLEAEKDANLLQYHQCLDKISNLEDIISQAEKNARELDERASKAETEALSLKDELAKLTSEKDAALDQYVLSLEKISHLENRLQLVEEDARKSSERAEKAEREIETLRQEISKLTEEKEAAALQYQQCLGTISSLENKLSSTQEEAQRLRVEIDNGVAKLKGAEEQCVMLERSNQSLHAELESLMLKMGAQGQELTEKQKEVGRLWSCVQEERLRFVEAETAFQTLQHLHAQTQEELHTLALELQNRVQLLKDIEAHNQGLQDEVSKIKEENMGLNELNVSSAMSIKNMQEQITILTEAKGKLEEEVELRVDQRNALQQEIYCLKEEVNDLNKKHLSVLEQVHAVGFNPERLKSSVTELQDENSNLKEACERERSEKKALLEKLEILGQVLEKNSILENSLSDLSAELEAVRGKINALEESCQSLLQEKSVLLDEKASLESQLQAANANLETLSEKNTVLENSLFDAQDELQTLKVKSKSLEDSCQLLADQNAGLATEKDNLSSLLEITQLRSSELEKRLADLRERYLLLEKDKASALRKIEELQISLDGEKQEHANFTQMNETRFAAIQSKMNLLQEKCHLREREFDIELDRAVHSEIEIFILQRCGEDLKESNESLSIKYEKLLEASTLSVNLISQLQKENIEHQNEVKSLSQKTSILRKGILPLLMALDLVLDGACPETFEQDLLNLTCVLHKIEEVKRSFDKAEEENELLCLEKMVLVTLLRQLRLEAEGLKVEKSNIEQELKTRNKHFSMLQTEAAKLHTMNEGLKVKLMEGNYREEALMTEVRSLQRKLLDVQGSLEVLHTENLKILEVKQSLVEETVLLKDSNYTLEEENYVLCGETLSTVYLSLIFKNYIDEKTLKMRELGEHLDKLQFVNAGIQEKLNSTERTLEEVQIENHSLQESLQQSEDELKFVTEIKDKLIHEIEMAKNLLHEEREKAKIHEETLQSELQKQMNEIEMLETHAAALFGQFQTSTVYQVLYEQKIHELTEAFDSLRDASSVKDTDIELLKERVSMLKIENHSLQESLQESEDELKFVTEIKDKLIHESEMAKNLLHEEREKAKIHEETLQSELQKQMNEIEMLETHAAALFGQLQTSTVYQVLYEQKIHELTEAFDSLRDASSVKDIDIELLKERVSTLKIENHSLQESLQQSEDELKFVTEIKDKLIHEIEMAKNLLHEEREKAKIHEETLQSELQKQMNEIEMLEMHAAALFGQFQTSTVYQVLYEQKIHELTEAFDSLRDASSVKDTDIELLKERVSMLTAENEGLNVQLAAYGPAMTSLKNCISSLEDKTSLRGKIQKAENEELEGAEVANDLDEHCFVDEENVMVPDFQNLQNRVQAIEKKVVEREQIVMQENSDVRSQLEAALMQIDELKGSLRRRNFKPTSETSEAENNTLLTKDIILDQVNEHSPFGISRNQPVKPDNRTLELSETADQDHSIDLTVDKAREMITPTPEEKTNFLRIKSVKNQKGEYPASDALVEKELAVDKLEVSKNSVDHIQEGNNRKVLQRLNSDVHKLMNLHITVQDLKRKLEITEKSRKGKAVNECDTLKGQLEEAEATILTLFDLNGKLMKNMEAGSFSSEKKSTTESEDFGSARREISGQARRISEKIGRVQMEVQKIQFVLLKLDDEKESKGKTKGSETRRVRLRDYLYGGLRTNHTGRKKTPFCACIQPSTYED